jgi:hypothetical protein
MMGWLVGHRTSYVVQYYREELSETGLVPEFGSVSSRLTGKTLTVKRSFSPHIFTQGREQIQFPQSFVLLGLWEDE